MDKGYVRVATEDDARYLSTKLRATDINELLLSNNTKPLTALLNAFEGKNNRVYSIVFQDKVIGMFGICDCFYLPKYGVVWLLGSDEISKVGRQFLKECKLWVNKMHKDYNIIYNWVHPDNWKSLKWLQYCGFEIKLKQEYGINGEIFYLMMREKKDV